MILAGIDPGATGAIVLYDTVKRNLVFIDVPTYRVKVGRHLRTRIDSPRLGWLLGQYQVDHALIEEVGFVAGQGGVSSFSFGKAAGIVEGIAGALQIPTRFMRPKEWQKIAQFAGGKEIKDNARRRAAELFPAHAEMFARKKDSGRADAALMAYALAVELELWND